MEADHCQNSYGAEKIKYLSIDYSAIFRGRLKTNKIQRWDLRETTFVKNCPRDVNKWFPYFPPHPFLSTWSFLDYIHIIAARLLT